MITPDLSQRHEKSASLYMKLEADSGYTSESSELRISAEQWAVINRVVCSPDGVSRRLLNEIYNAHVKDAA